MEVYSVIVIYRGISSLDDYTNFTLFKTLKSARAYFTKLRNQILSENSGMEIDINLSDHFFALDGRQSYDITTQKEKVHD